MKPATSKGIGGHTRPNNGETNNWITPMEIIQKLGPFDLDPCAHTTMPWKTADEMWTVKENGLTRKWHGRVWLNPPYGSACDDWLCLMAAHNFGSALIFARTETRMFHKYIWPKAAAVFFFEGRLHFHYPDGTRAQGNAGGPSALFAFGSDDRRRLQHFDMPGKYIALRM